MVTDIANLKCVLWGHKKPRETYRGYQCTRCYSYTVYSPRTTHAITFLISFIGAFALIGITALYFGANHLSFMTVPCCNSMGNFLPNNLNLSATDGFKPCYIVNQAVKENAVNVGDVITYKYKNNVTVLHRIKAECNDTSEMFFYEQGNKTYVIGEPVRGFMIQGDNNPEPDGCIPAWSIQSRFKYKLFCLADYVK